MKPAVKIVARSYPSRRSVRRHPIKRASPPMDVRTKVLLVGSAIGLVAITALVVFGIRDARVLTTGLFLAVVGPMYLTITRLETYLPRAHSVRKRELLNVPLGVPLGAAVFFVWGLFPPLYTALEEFVWGPSEVAGGAYLESVQIALGTAGGYLIGLVLGSLLVTAQAAVWVVPAYLLAKWVTKPLEDEVEEFYRQKIRQSTRRVIGRPSQLTKFKVGGELAETKVQLREYGTMLCLFSGLITILALAWITPYV